MTEIPEWSAERAQWVKHWPACKGGGREEVAPQTNLISTCAPQHPHTVTYITHVLDNHREMSQIIQHRFCDKTVLCATLPASTNPAPVFPFGWRTLMVLDSVGEQQNTS